MTGRAQTAGRGPRPRVTSKKPFIWVALLLQALPLAPSRAADLRGAAGHPAAAVLVGTEGRILFSASAQHRQFFAASVPAGTGDLFDVVWIENLNSFVAVGAAGEILVSSSNIGNAWSERPSGVGADLRGVGEFAASTTFAVAVGSGGTIVRSASPELGGWQEEASPTGEGLWDVVQGSSVSVSVGENGTILKGSRNGTAWVSVTSPVTADLLAVTVESQGNFIAVGEDGVILRGLGDGVTWIVIDEPASNVTLHDVVGLDFNPPSVAVGAGGKLMISTSTGLQWSDVETTTASNLRAVAFTGTDFVACGDAESVVWSAAGFAWEDVTALAPTSWGRIKNDFLRR
jgi:photosystem II stability/assembly factor-like uncharacterized protein